MIRCWRVDTPAQTILLASFDEALVEVIYWGAPLPAGENVEAFAAQTRQFTMGSMLDALPSLSVCPSVGEPGLIAHSKDGPIFPNWRFATERVEEGLELGFEDTGLGLGYTLFLSAHGDIVTARAELTCQETLTVSWFAAPAMPAPQNSDHHITFSGRWCQEFQRNRTPWSPGALTNAAPGGRTSHEFQPAIVIPAKGTTECSGEAWAAHLGWSGGHRLVAEQLADGRRQVQMGHHGTQVIEGKLQSPELHLAYSGKGLNGVSQSYHAFVRQEILTLPEGPRPVHYNCWEAVYFDHRPEELKALASKAAALGVERFVLDDGWFGRRDDDTSSLGDWFIDTRKWPNGLTPLIDHVASLGMSFGLWFEPEMINEDSDLYRAHPDWVLGPVDQVRGRNQLVLDMAREDVRAYLFDAMSGLLDAHDIAYIKWDHNRPLPLIGPAQTRGTYALLDALRKAHPNVEIETCASGGGRIDFEILKRTHRFWTSDSNDAKARWDIQRGASYFFPPEIAGAHVGPETCHTSGRRFPIEYRASVAATRAFGLEMDLGELSDADAETLKAAITTFKASREILHGGALHRLDSDDLSVSAEMHINGTSFLLYAAQLEPSAQQLSRPLRLTGLDPDAEYTVTQQNPEHAHATMNRGYTNPLTKGVTLSGAVLMRHGLTLPQTFPDTIWTLTGEKTK